MPAELALHRRGNLASLQREGRFGEFRHHAVLREEAEIATTLARAGVLRGLDRDLGEVLAALHAGMDLFRLVLPSTRMWRARTSSTGVSFATCSS